MYLTRLRVSIVLLCALATGCTGDRYSYPPVSSNLFVESPSERCVQADSQGNCLWFSLSIPELIANADLYHGEVVQVVGYTVFAFESYSIYPSRDSRRYGSTSSALWLETAGISESEVRKCHRSHCLVRGTFDGRNRGHLGAYPGTITEITRMVPWD